MTTIVTLVLLAIVAMCAWSGYKRGLLMGVGSLLAIIIALYGANLLSNAFSFEIIPALRPFASGYMEQQIDAEGGAVDRMGWGELDYSVGDLLAQHPEQQHQFCVSCYEALGIEESAANTMADRAVIYARDNDADATTAVVQVLCETVSYVMCFVLAFLLILILLTVIGNLPNLSYKLPDMDIVNDVGGVLLGIAQGLAFCAIIVWALRFTGKITGVETLSGSWLTRILLEHNFLSNYLPV